MEVAAKCVSWNQGKQDAMKPHALYPRHRLDISAHDVLYGLSACLWARGDQKLAADILRVCSMEGDGLVCFSVRSGWDLLLEVLTWTPEDEVLVSAVTHPDMVRIIERHGLRAVPVDLDTATLEPRIEALEGALSTRTRAILVAHLFGGSADLAPVAAFARRHGLLLIEDCAQAFRGVNELGDPAADVSMFSFGTLKTATAAGGAILRIRDPALRARMGRTQERWPVQRRRDHAARLLKVLGLVLFGRPLPYHHFFRAWDLLGRDPDAVVNTATRAFPRSGGGLTGGFQHRPSAPLLALLARRLRGFDATRLACRARVGEEVSSRLPAPIQHPGSLSRSRTHWLFPVMASDPEALILALRRQGFDASRATSNIAAVRAPGFSEPEAAIRMMSKVVFLPVYPEIPEKALRRLAGAIEWAAEESAVVTQERSTA